MSGKIIPMKHNMKKTNFYFPVQMLGRLKIASQKKGLPVSEVIRNAIEKYLSELGV